MSFQSLNPSYKWNLDRKELPDWSCVESFAEWYFANNMPWLPPDEIVVSCSDDATAMTMFSIGSFRSSYI